MPFPKSSSIAARATEVYSETWGAVLHKCWNTPLSREDDLSDLFQLLPYLRQLLTCCACAGLLENAMISITCGHCYCYDCQFRPPLLKIQCRQCRERSGLVNENQLRMIVQGYKHMCFILAEMLSRNPLILKPFATSSENSASEGNKICVENGTTSEADKMDTCKGSGSQRGSELKVSETGTQIEFQKGKGTVSVDADFDPIAEIIKEVQQGVKAPRSVLVVKPPLKYLNIKAPAATSKKESKDQPSTSAVAAAGSSQSRSQSSQKSTPGKKSKLNISTKFSNVSTEKKPVEKEDETEKGTKASQDCVEESRTEIKRSKKRGKRPKHQSERSLSGTPPKQRRQQLIDNDWTRIENMATSSEEEIDIVGLTKSTSEVNNVTYEDLTRAKFLLEDLQPNDLEVGDGCLDQDYINVTPGHLTLKDQVPDESEVFERLLAYSDHIVDTPISAADCETPVSVVHLMHTRFKQASDGDRQRTWDPLCPKVVVKRSKTAIDKMILLQTKSVRGKLRARERSKSARLKALATPSPPVTTSPETSNSLPPPQIILPENGSTLNNNDPMMDFEDIFTEDFSLECLRTLEEELPDLDFQPIPHYPPMMSLPQLSHAPPRYVIPRHQMPHPHGPMAPPTLMLAPPPHPFHPPIIIPAKPNKITTVPISMGPAVVGKLNLKSPEFSKHLLSPAGGEGGGVSKKRKSPGYSESGWRCRCGTNSVMFPEKVCAKGKCPCFSKGIPCKNCLCRTCHNPFNTGGPVVKTPVAAVSSRESVQNEEMTTTDSVKGTCSNAGVI